MSFLKPLLILVDDDASTLGALERLLRNDFEIQSFTDAEQALEQLKSSDPALILTDSIMPKMSGLEFLKRVRSVRPNSVRALLSGQIASDELSEAINHGLIHRFFVKPWDNQILKLQLLECLQQRKMLVEKDQLATLALTDPVTGLGNHRLFQEQIRSEIERAKRHQRIVTLMMMDLDHFKSWNDNFGHPAGDLLLKEVASLLVRSLRTIDWIARYGGDEFAMILPDTSATHAFTIAERLRKQFSEMTALNQGPVRLSISFGIASYPEHGLSARDLIRAADLALYQAKNQGRNQSIIAGSSN